MVNQYVFQNSDLKNHFQ